MGDKKDYHGQGQKDAAAGRSANPPHGSLLDTVGALAGLTPSSTLREQDRERREYKAGYEHAEKQR